MKAADRSSRHGAKRHIPKGSDEKVVAFFNEEREAIESRKEVKSLSRITRLPTMWSPPFFSVGVIDSDFNNATRGRYFRDTCTELRSHGPVIAFLDPDTGISINRVAEQYVLPQEAGLVFDALSEGSCLLIYQHNPQQKDWKSKKLSNLNDSLDVPAQIVMDGGDIVFYGAFKSALREINRA